MYTPESLRVSRTEYDYDSKTQRVRSLHFIGAAPADTKPDSAKGHRLLDQKGWLGMLNGIMIYPQTATLSAGAGARREGHAAGW